MQARQSSLDSKTSGVILSAGGAKDLARTKTHTRVTTDDLYFSVDLSLNVLFAMSLSGTLPSLTTISWGAAGISIRITPLLFARTSSRFVVSPPANFTVIG